MAFGFILSHSYTEKASGQSFLVKKGPLIYDFTFAELAIKYLDTSDTVYLDELSKCDAARHIFNHAIKFNYSVPKDSPRSLIKYLLSPVEEKRRILPEFKLNLQFARDSIAGTGIVPKECLAFLPKGFEFKNPTCLFFTFGYDLGVVYAGNASINLANPHYLKSMREIRYYSIHELHHAGFVTLRNNFMPSLNISKYKEMARLIEYYTQMEGMAVYAAVGIREKEHALADDNDYVVLNDSALMKTYVKEFFDIYFHFKNNPDGTITDADWDKLSILSDGKRLWYRVGALMAQTIDRKFGRKKLVSLIKEPSESFFKIFLTADDINHL
jgi:hypothetical protein